MVGPECDYSGSWEALMSRLGTRFKTRSQPEIPPGTPQKFESSMELFGWQKTRPLALLGGQDPGGKQDLYLQSDWEDCVANRVVLVSDFELIEAGWFRDWVGYDWNK